MLLLKGAGDGSVDMKMLYLSQWKQSYRHGKIWNSNGNKYLVYSGKN